MFVNAVESLKELAKNLAVQLKRKNISVSDIQKVNAALVITTQINNVETTQVIGCDLNGVNHGVVKENLLRAIISIGVTDDEIAASRVAHADVPVVPIKGLDKTDIIASAEKAVNDILEDRSDLANKLRTKKEQLEAFRDKLITDLSDEEIQNMQNVLDKIKKEKSKGQSKDEAKEKPSEEGGASERLLDF
jgi:hypothetical protein